MSLRVGASASRRCLNLDHLERDPSDAAELRVVGPGPDEGIVTELKIRVAFIGKARCTRIVQPFRAVNKPPYIAVRAQRPFDVYDDLIPAVQNEGIGVVGRQLPLPVSRMIRKHG